LILVAALSAVGCGPKAPQAPARPTAIRDRVAFDFEQAVKTNKDAYVALFDFTSVGEYEILLHRYDLLGRFPDLDDARRTQFQGEDGTPYPPTRERRNVGNFYPILAQRTVGTGGCTASAQEEPLRPAARHEVRSAAGRCARRLREAAQRRERVARPRWCRRHHVPRRPRWPRDRVHAARNRARLRPDHDLRRRRRVITASRRPSPSSCSRSSAS